MKNATSNILSQNTSRTVLGIALTASISLGGIAVALPASADTVSIATTETPSITSPIPEPIQSASPPTSGLGATMGQGLKEIKETEKVETPNPSKSLTASPLASPLNTSSGVYGMDVSGWQADAYSHSISQVNWSKQWSMGSKFAYAKATEGSSFIDQSRNSHLTGASKVGMLTGAYHFALPGQGTATSQADFFVNNGGTWKADGKSLPPLLDIEYNPYSSLGNTCYNLSPVNMVKWIKEFSSRVQSRTGRLPMIYTTTDWWNHCTGSSTAFSAQPLHLAAYSSYIGAMPKGWAYQSVWQYSSTGPFAGDSNLWNGTLAGLKNFASKAVLSPQDSGITPIPPVVKANPSIKSGADVIAADKSGILWNYSATGQGKLNNPTQIGVGWTGLRSISVTDWNADGIFDIIAQWTNGKVTTYLGRLGGGFSTGPVLAASGWSNNQLIVGPWVSGKYPQIISREANGTLKLWSNPSGNALGASKTIGNGWGGLDLMMVDFDGNRTQDLIARNGNGDLLLYRSDGKGNFLSQTRPKIGVGWNIMTSLSVATGFNGGSTSGIVARNSSGVLSYYATPGNNTFGKPITIGNSWGSMLIAGGENIKATTPSPPKVVSPPVAPIVVPKHPLAPVGKPAISTLGDAVSIDSSGFLLVYPYKASGSYGSAMQIGHGFGAFNAVQVADFNSDGVNDLIAQRNDKSISVYYGNKTGGFSGSRVVANAGWTGTEIIVGKWKKTDKYPGIISMDANGGLFEWANPNGTSLSSAKKIGTGWKGLKITMVDFDRNGTQDLLAVNNTGSMLLYRGTGTGGFLSQTRPIVGQGWGALEKFRGISSPSGVNALMNNKELRFYPIVAANKWGNQRVVVKGLNARVTSP